MTFEEYQSLSSEEKMIARFRSLENVARASHFTLVSHDTGISEVELTPSKLIKGTITRSAVSVRVGPSQAKGRALAMKMRRTRKQLAGMKFYGKPVAFVEDETEDHVKLKAGDTVFIAGTPFKVN